MIVLIWNTFMRFLPPNIAHKFVNKIIFRKTAKIKEVIIIKKMK